MKKRELAIVLAAMRTAQTSFDGFLTMPHLKGLKKPTREELDDLCMRFNCGEMCGEDEIRELRRELVQARRRVGSLEAAVRFVDTWLFGQFCDLNAGGMDSSEHKAYRDLRALRRRLDRVDMLPEAMRKRKEARAGA